MSYYILWIIFSEYSAQLGVYHTKEDCVQAMQGVVEITTYHSNKFMCIPTDIIPNNKEVK